MFDHLTTFGIEGLIQGRGNPYSSSRHLHVHNRNTRTTCEISSKLTINKPE